MSLVIVRPWCGSRLRVDDACCVGGGDKWRMIVLLMRWLQRSEKRRSTLAWWGMVGGARLTLAIVARPGRARQGASYCVCLQCPAGRLSEAPVQPCCECEGDATNICFLERGRGDKVVRVEAGLGAWPSDARTLEKPEKRSVVWLLVTTTCLVPLSWSLCSNAYSSLPRDSDFS